MLKSDKKGNSKDTGRKAVFIQSSLILVKASWNDKLSKPEGLSYSKSWMELTSSPNSTVATMSKVSHVIRLSKDIHWSRGHCSRWILILASIIYRNLEA